MKIGVLSDTHLRSPDSVLDLVLEDLFADAEMILHAGDIVSLPVLHRLEQWGVIAVCGNMDDYEIVGALPQMRVVSAAGKRIGLIHGWGSSEGLQRRILQRFQDPRPDLIVFGHSHTPFWGAAEGILMFNPGQTVIRIRGGSVGIIEIEGDKVEGRFSPLHA